MIEVVPNWHPVIVHFTVALLLISVAMFVAGYWLQKKSLKQVVLQVAQWNYWMGTIAAVLTAIAGWFAYNSVAHDTASHAAMTVHRNWALTALAVILLMAAFLSWRKRAKRDLPGLLLGGMLSVAVLLTITAWHGGELVYRYGLGVMSMPIPEGEGHAHDHGADNHHGTADSLSVEDNKPMPQHSATSAQGHDDIHSTSGISTKSEVEVPTGHEHHNHEH